MKNLHPWVRFLVIWGCVVLMAASFYFARVVLIPIVLSILLTCILAPLVSLVQRTGLGRVGSSLIVVSVACLVVGAIGLVIVYQTSSLMLEIPEHKETIVAKVEAVRDMSREHFSPVYDVISWFTPDEDPNKQAITVNQTNYWAWIQSTLGSTLEFLVNLGLVIILVAFMLIAREDLRNRIIRLSGTKNITAMTKALDDASVRISNFLLMQMIINVTYGIATGIGLWLIDVPYALLFGFTAAIVRYIPYLGPWIGVIFPIALSIAVFPDWWPLLWVVGFFIVLELLSNNVMEPLLYGRSIGVSEIAVLVMAVVWTWLWGPLGLVLSTPLTACMVVLGRYVPALGFLDVLLGDRAALPRHLAFYQRLLARDEDEAATIVEEYLKKHARENIYDELILPGLQLAKAAHERGDLSSEDLAFVHDGIRHVLDDFGGSFKPAFSGGDAELPQRLDKQATAKIRGKEAEASLVVVGCPIKDESDELALGIFGELISMSGCRYEVLPHGKLVGEVRDYLADEEPHVVCLFSVPPGGRVQTRLLCKRLRHEFPDLKIIAAIWKPDADKAETHAFVESAGADDVATTFLELRDKLLSLAPVLTAQAKRKQTVEA